MIATLLALLLGSSALNAGRVLVVGDSWAKPIVPALQEVLDENGHADISVDETPFIGQSWQMRDNLGAIAAWLQERPDAIVVHIFTGGNDFGASDWTPSWTENGLERALIQGIIQNVDVVVDHILSLRPNIQVLWSSYDFPRPYGRGTPLEINTFWMTFAEQAAQYAATKPGLSFANLNGTLQVVYGFDGVQHTTFDPGSIIPPGDPSLPNPAYPSPFEPFIPNEPYHLIPSGYKVMAQAQYDLFYEPLLTGRNFQINPGINDAWYNPVTDGQGFLIIAFPEIKQVFLAWFTYDTELPPEDATANLGDPGHRWLTAQGVYAGNQSVMDIVLTSGGLFDTPSDVTRTDPPGSDGTLILTFDDCYSGTVDYDITTIDQQGTIPIQRIVTDNVPLCEALMGQ